ncbi:Alkanesulfonates-binding protein [Pseudomonas sp. FEN]|nr:Alkanesulfonates-binding protein [Pseudomonas sp. FEN]
MRFTQPLKHLLFSTALTFGAASHATDLQPLLVANQKSTIKVLLEVSGELKDVPYEIQFSEFPAAAPLGEALNAGAVDIGALGDAPYVFALGAGAPLKVVSILHAEGRYTTAILAPKDSSLNTAADLKGKRIVTTRGSIGHFLAIKTLRSVGLTTQDVQFIYLLPSESRILLDNGGADAWSTWDPYTTIATTQSQAKVLVSGDRLLTNHLYSRPPTRPSPSAPATGRLRCPGRPCLSLEQCPSRRVCRRSGQGHWPALAVHIAVAKATHMQPVEISDA